jgi:hypothetical protein
MRSAMPPRMERVCLAASARLQVALGDGVEYADP